MSIVGADRLPDSGYLRAKVAQEELIKGSSMPYSIVRATQFFEFIDSIVGAATEGDTVRVSPMLIQPMAAGDVARAVGKVAAGAPLNGTIEIAGPEAFPLDELVRRDLSARHDPRRVVADPHAEYFGTELAERSLVPDVGAAQLGGPASRTGSPSPCPSPSPPTSRLLDTEEARCRAWPHEEAPNDRQHR